MNIPFILKENAPLPVEQVKEVFESFGVETRPIIAGNLTKHPAIKKIHCRINVSLEVSDQLLDRGFMIGCAPSSLNDSAIMAIEQAVKALSSR